MRARSCRTASPPARRACGPKHSFPRLRSFYSALSSSRRTMRFDLTGDHDHRYGPHLVNPCDQLIRIMALVGLHGLRVEPLQLRLGLCPVMSFTPGTVTRSGLPNTSHTACSLVVNPSCQRPQACVSCPLGHQIHPTMALRTRRLSPVRPHRRLCRGATR
jgi:hypothetical protein